MEPIDLTSVAGIVAATIALVEALKRLLGDAPGFRRVPVAVYVIGLALALTWLAHSALGILEGSLVELLLQAVLQAAAASGLVEWYRAGSKPIASTSAAIARRPPPPKPWRPRRVPAVLLAIGLTLATAACASTGRLLVEADRAVHTALSVTQDRADIVCDAPPVALVEPCARFNGELAAALEAGDRFNRAVRAQSVGEVPAMLRALDDLAQAVARFFPTESEQVALRARIEDALALLRQLARGGA